MPDLAWLLPIHDVIEFVENAGDLRAELRPISALAQPVERALHGLVRRAIVIHRRGVAVADRAVLGADADDPAFRRRVGGEREFPVLVLLRAESIPRPARQRSSSCFSRSFVSDRLSAGVPSSFGRGRGVARCGSRSPARSMRGSSSSRMCGKVVHIVDHAERKPIEAGAAQALERLDRVVVAADASESRRR